MSQKVSTFKLYVSNLPPGVTGEDVSIIFEKYGRVVEREIFKGSYAFVHMEDEEAALAAIRDLDQQQHEGNILSVRASNNSQGPKMPTMKLMVLNLSPMVSAKQLRDMFTRFGFVLEAEVRKGEGHVLLEATGDIRSAINEISGTQIDGLTLKVEPANSYCPSNPSQAPSKPAGKFKPSVQTEPPSYHPGPLRPHRMMVPGIRHRPVPPPFMGGPPMRYPGPMMPRRPPPMDFTDDYSYDEEIGPRLHGEEYDDRWEYGPPEPYHPPRMLPPPMHRPMFHEMHRPRLHPPPFHPPNQMRPFLPPPPVHRIPRDRFRAEPVPRPLFDPDPNFAEDDPGFPVHGPPTNPRNVSGNRFKASKPAAPKRPGQTATPLLRTAKVTKFGKIVPDQPQQRQKKRGNRGGQAIKAKKQAKQNGKGALPSLLDPIPGTVRPAQPKNNQQQSNIPASKPAKNKAGGVATEEIAQPLLALHHAQKRTQASHNQLMPLKAASPAEDIDFTEDIQF